MSMVMLTIFHLIGIFCAYLFITVALPSYVFGRKLCVYRVPVRVMLYFLIGNFYVMNLVFALQLMKISYPATLIIGTFVPAFVTRVLINRIPVFKIVTDMVSNLRKLIGGQMGRRTAVHKLGKFTGKQLSRFGRWLGKNLFPGFIDCVLILAMVVVLWWIYGRNLIEQFGYKASDIIVHNYWINAMDDNNIFVAGVYPHGFHCVVYYIHAVFGYDVYVILRVFAFVQNVMIHMMLLCFLRACCRSRYAAYIGTGAYVIGDFFAINSYSRYYATLPQEFGMLFIFPGIYFLFAYFQKRKQEVEAHEALGKSRKKRFKWLPSRRKKAIEAALDDTVEMVSLDEPERVLAVGSLTEVSLEEIDLDDIRMLELDEELPGQKVQSTDPTPKRGRLHGIFGRKRWNRSELPKGKRKRKNYPKSWIYLTGFVLSFAMTLAVHFYGTMIAGVFCMAVAVGYGFLLFKKKYFWNIMAAGMISVTLAVLPMVLAFIGGTPLEGSLMWAMSIIQSNKEEEVSDKTVNEEIVIPENSATGGIAADAAMAEGSSTGAGTGYDGGGQHVVDETPKPGIGERMHGLVTSVVGLMQTIWYSTCGMLRMAVLDMPIEYVRWLVISFAVLVALGLVHRLFRQSCYGAMLVSAGVYLIFLCIMLIAGNIGLPALMDYNRASIYIAYSLPIGLSLLVDGILALLFLPMKHKFLQHFASLVCVILVIGFIVEGNYVKSLDRLYQLDTIRIQEPNEAIVCLTNIIRGEKDFTWTIVSANDMTRMAAGHGFHYEIITFLHEMEGANPNAMVYIPTNVVYFFIEKVPIDYNLPYSNSGQEISRDGASRVLPANSGVGMYQGEKRWIVMSRMYYWAQEFQRWYPDDLETYLETDAFVCYRIEQNPYRLYNMAINYGYNEHVIEEEE
ncbi:MAG: hypothetical protein J1E64_02795 [Acetatifactor sp.]|nr:hypothetical protein [Acetatifactor sp.]